MLRALIVLAGISAFLAAPAAARQPARLDLAAGTVDGRTIIGRSLEDVTAGWGRPTARHVGRVGATSWVRYGSPTGFRLRVEFWRRGGRFHAVAFTVASPAVSETRLGRALALRPEQLERRLLTEYDDAFFQDVGDEYQCVKGTCSGALTSLFGRRRLFFGRFLGRTYVTLYGP